MMKSVSESTLDLVFAALSDQTRRAILDRLTQSSATVTELARPFEMSLPAISKHLQSLEKAGLITRTKAGRVHHLSLAPDKLHDVARWLDHYRRFWDQNLDSLADYLDSFSEENSEESLNDQSIL